MHRLVFRFAPVFLTLGLLAGCGSEDPGAIASDDELTEFLEANPEIDAESDEEDELMDADDELERP